MKILYICNTCGKETERVSIHHILPRSLGGRDLDTNIIKICGTCHAKIHGTEGLLSSSSLIKIGLEKRKGAGHVLGAVRKVNKADIDGFNHLKNAGYSYADMSKLTGYAVGTIHKYISDVKEVEQP